MISVLNPLVTLHQADVLDGLAAVEAESVHCIVTSPPYWVLRSYSGEQMRVWDAPGKGCEHQWGGEHRAKRGHAGDRSTLMGAQTAHLSKEAGGSGAFCSRCAAWRGALGQEPTVELYTAHLMLVMAALWRVLRMDGLCWINLDDTRQSGSHTGLDGGPKQSTNRGASKDGLRPKDMALIPERFILAAQAQGWYVRSKVVWSPTNPMPESVAARPTDAYQMLYCLTKTAATQFWTHRTLPGVRHQPKPDYRWQKVRPLTPDPAWHNSSFSDEHDLAVYDGVSDEPRKVEVLEERTTPPPGWTPKSKGDWRRVNLWRGHSVWWDGEAIAEPSQSGPSDVKKMLESKERIGGRNKEATDPLLKASALTNIGRKRAVGNPSSRNARNVQTWPTEGLGSFRVNGKTLTHFAAFPRALPNWCIRACPATCCGRCGAGYARLIAKKAATMSIRVRDAKRGVATAAEVYKASPSELENYGKEEMGETRTLGWSPTCQCPQDLPTVPGLVLDPFLGSGTTALAAQELGRRCVGIDLSVDYITLAQHRLEREQPAMPGAWLR